MDLFARCFLLVFSQIYVGGMLALSVPPFHEMERGYFKSTAGVYLGLGLLAFLARLALLLRATPATPGLDAAQACELVLWFVSLAGASVYLWSLWGERFVLRARAYVAAWMAGVLALCVGAQTFRLAPWLSLEVILYPINLLLPALVLGGATGGMLLGHWYLIDRDLTLDPLKNLFRLFVGALIAQSVFLVLTPVLFALTGSEATTAALARLFDEHRSLMWARLLVSPLSTAGLAWMVWKTLQIPQTMAATGLLYIAILSSVVGELLGRFVLFRTALPL